MDTGYVLYIAKCEGVYVCLAPARTSAGVCIRVTLVPHGLGVDERLIGSISRSKLSLAYHRINIERAY